MFVWMPAAQSWIHLNKWVMTLFLASTRAKSIHRLCGCVWACVHPCKWVQVLCVCLCTYASVYARLWVSVRASCLESRVSLRWATADILVCFNPLANKTAGNHQKNTSSWTGRTAWEKIGEEVCTPVWMKNKLKPGSRERREKGEGGLSTRCKKKSVICVWCRCVCVCVSQHGGSDSGSCCFCGVSPATPDNLHLSLPYWGRGIKGSEEDSGKRGIGSWNGRGTKKHGWEQERGRWQERAHWEC